MGFRAFVNSSQNGMASTSKGASSGQVKPVHFKFDVLLMLATIALVLFGILMVYSASADFSFSVFEDTTYVFRRQLLWLGLGITVACVLTLLDYHLWEKLALFAMGVAMIGLVAVLIFQDERFGAMRSLFSGSVQPSELAKFMIVVYLAVWLYNRRDQLKDVSFGLIPLALILGFVGGLIAAQPDLSALLTVVILGIMMFFLAGGELKQIVIVFVIGLIVGWLVLRLNIFSTGTYRVTSFLAGIRDPMEYSDHVRRSLESFVRGGWFGVGIGKAETKLVGLPFPHTDSIFAVIGEETGIFGATILIGLYLFLMWRGLIIARQATDPLGALLAGGLSFWLATEAFINMAVMVGLMPFAGNALPFISSGGSNLVVTLAAVGTLLSVSRVSYKVKSNEEKTYSAIVDLRRGNRRGSVSRPRHTASPKK